MSLFNGCVGLIYFVNFIFFVLGNLYFSYNYDFLKYPLLENNSDDQKLIFLCVLASAILVTISLIGFYDTLFDKPYLRKTYVILIFIFIVLQIFIVSWFLEYSYNNFSDVLKEKLFKNYNQLDTENQKFIDNLQTDYKCCGLKFYNDYEKDINKLPRSCFKPGTVKYCTTTGLYTRGCLIYITTLYRIKKKDFTVMLVLVLGTQFLAIIFLILLSKTFREKYNFFKHKFWVQN